VAWFDDHGLELLEEADGRMFPRSNRSSSVIDSLRQAAAAAGVVLRTHTALQAADPLAPAGFLLQLQTRRSGAGERAAASVPTAPPAPGRASMMNCWPICPVSLLVNTRLTLSVALPGAWAIRMRIGLAG
jgi:hypothetical protein